MAAKKSGLGKGLDSLITNKVKPADSPSRAEKIEKKPDTMVKYLWLNRTENSQEKNSMKMVYWNYPNQLNSMESCSLYLYRIKTATMKL